MDISQETTLLSIGNPRVSITSPE